MRIFIVAAIVLIVFAIIAGASHTAKCLGIDWYIWTAASLLAFYTDILIGGWVGGLVNINHTSNPNPPVQ